jgi:hypothetical protein
VLSGPSGVGKLVLALDPFQATLRSSLQVHACGTESGDVKSELRSCPQSARGGTLVLDDVDQLSAAWQEGAALEAWAATTRSIAICPRASSPPRASAWRRRGNPGGCGTISRRASTADADRAGAARAT